MKGMVLSQAREVANTGLATMRALTAALNERDPRLPAFCNYLVGSCHCNCYACAALHAWQELAAQRKPGRCGALRMRLAWASGGLWYLSIASDSIGQFIGLP